MSARLAPKAGRLEDHLRASGEMPRGSAISNTISFKHSLDERVLSSLQQREFIFHRTTRPCPARLIATARTHSTKEC